MTFFSAQSGHETGTHTSVKGCQGKNVTDPDKTYEACEQLFLTVNKLYLLHAAKQFWSLQDYEFKAAYNRLEPAILNVLRVVKANAPYSDLLYISVATLMVAPPYPVSCKAR